ncbi:MAG: universal stress protein [Pirellulales bacterium]
MVQRILCPVDFSDRSRESLKYAAGLAHSLHAKLVLLHAFDLPATLDLAGQTTPLDPALRPQLDEWAGAQGELTAEVILHAGHPGEVICWVAQDRKCDLIVMGTHGRTGLLRTLLGSTAEHVLRHARCPVLTIREISPHEPPLAEPMVLPLNAPRFM